MTAASPARVIAVSLKTGIWLRIYDHGELIAVPLSPHAAAVLAADLIHFAAAGGRWPEPSEGKGEVE